jgi:hypothetical protein
MLSLMFTKKLAFIIHKAHYLSNSRHFNANENEWHSIFDLISNGVTYTLN